MNEISQWIKIENITAWLTNMKPINSIAFIFGNIKFPLFYFLFKFPLSVQLACYYSTVVPWNLADFS